MTRRRATALIVAFGVLGLMVALVAVIPRLGGQDRRLATPTTEPSAPVVASPPAIDLNALRWTVNLLPELRENGVAAIERVMPFHDGFLGFGPRWIRDAEFTPPSVFLQTDDGITWTAIAEAPQDLVIETALVVDSTAWVIGHAGPEEDPDRQLWTSADGHDWVRQSDDEWLDFGPGEVSDVVRTKDVWLAHQVVRLDPESGRSIYLLSTNGIEWEEIPPPAVGRSVADGRIVAGDDVLVAMTSSNQDGRTRTLVSTDGRNWTAGPAFDGGGHALAWADAGFVVTSVFNFDGEPTTGGWHSLDGLEWVPIRLEGAPAEDDATASKVIGFDGGYVTIGSDDADGAFVRQSLDGRVWSEVPGWPHDPWNQLNDVAAGARSVVIVGFHETPPNGSIPVAWVGEMP